MMIAFMGSMNVILKTSADLSSIQSPANKPGFSSKSKVSFDMFRFNSLMNDFRSDAVSSKPELVSRQSIQNEKYSQTQEEVNRKSGSFEKSQEVSPRQCSNTSKKLDSSLKDPEIAPAIDEEENIQERNPADNTSDESKEQTEVVIKENHQCSDDTGKCAQQPAGDATEENGLDNGEHIGLFLSNILNNVAGGLLPDNVVNQGEGSIVSEIAQSENKGQSANDLKNGNLLSNLIRGEIDNGKTSGQGGDLSASGSDITPDDLTGRMNTLQAGQAEAGTEGKSPNGSSNKVPVSQAGLQGSGVTDIFSDKPSDENASGSDGNLMKVQIKDKTEYPGGIREAGEEVSGKSEMNTDESGRSRIETDRKAEIRGNQIRQSQDTVTESGLKEVKSNETVMYDKPLANVADNIHVGTISKSTAGPNVRSEGISSENSNNGLLNNSNTSHESVKTGEVPKTANMTRPTAFNEVVDRITYILKGSTKMGVKLESESLGKLNINVSIEKGLVNVHIHSADKAVREFVENNMQQIVDSLSKNGVSVGGFSVGLRNNRNNESNADMNGSGRGNPFSVDRAKERDYISTAARAIHTNGLVNIFA